MSFFDVSDVLNDPDFVTDFTVMSFTERIDGKGRALCDCNVLESRGVIQPATAKELERLPEGDRYSQVVSVLSVYPLSTGEEREGGKPDEILHRGKRYQIVSAEDWRDNTGLGHSKGLAVLMQGTGA